MEYGAGAVRLHLSPFNLTIPSVLFSLDKQASKMFLEFQTRPQTRLRLGEWGKALGDLPLGISPTAPCSYFHSAER